MTTNDLITLPFKTIPNTTDDAPDIMTPNVQFVEKGNATMSSTDTAPWTGYYAIHGNQAVALVHKWGIWFEIRCDTSPLYEDEYYAFCVADPDLLIVHQPHDNTEFMQLWQSTNTHRVAAMNDPPPPLLRLTLTWPRGPYPHQGWALLTKEKVLKEGKI